MAEPAPLALYDPRSADPEVVPWLATAGAPGALCARLAGNRRGLEGPISSTPTAIASAGTQRQGSSACPPEPRI